MITIHSIYTVYVIKFVTKLLQKIFSCFLLKNCDRSWYVIYIIVYFNVWSKHNLIHAARHCCIRTCQYYGKCNWRLPSWIEALSINNEYCIREYVNLKIFFVVLFTSGYLMWFDKYESHSICNDIDANSNTWLIKS